MIFSGDKMAVAQFVGGLLVNSKLDSALITIMLRSKYEGCSVRIVTDTSLEGIVVEKAKNYSIQRINT